MEINAAKISQAPKQPTRIKGKNQEVWLSENLSVCYVQGEGHKVKIDKNYSALSIVGEKNDIFIEENYFCITITGSYNRISVRDWYCDEIYDCGENNQIRAVGEQTEEAMVINYQTAIISEFENEEKRIAGDKNDLCTICQNNYSKNDDIEYLNCSHTFHRSCLIPWLEKKLNCPICKQSIA